MPAPRSLVPLSNLKQALRLAEIRNSCREFFTNFNGEITPPMQERWFRETYLRQESRKFEVWLLCDEGSEEVPVGYCAVNHEPPGSFVTEGLLPEYRGQGLGHYLLSSLLGMPELRGRTVLADIFATNRSSIELHKRHGFTFEEAVSETIHRYRREN